MCRFTREAEVSVGERSGQTNGGYGSRLPLEELRRSAWRHQNIEHPAKAFSALDQAVPQGSPHSPETHWWSCLVEDRLREWARCRSDTVRRLRPRR